jgi:hypothetical protein
MVLQTVLGIRILVEGWGGAAVGQVAAVFA